MRVRWHATHRALAIVLALGVSLAGARGGLAQSAPTDAQLDTLVAPIALYPDALVAHILPASTFPVEIVEAARDLQNGGKPSDADMNSWDPSIQALVSVPSIIKMMNDRLSWTTQLGQAVSQDQAAVMAAIQRVRQKAQAVGNLKSTPQQTVTTEGSTIVIAPTNPQVIYVPQYDPVTILQPAPLWATPGYGLMTFGAGFTAGFFTAYACHWGGGWGWGGGGNNITVNNNYRWNSPNIKNSSINTNVSGNTNYKSWNAPKNVGHITNTYPGNNRPVDQGKLGGDQHWGDGGGRHDGGGGDLGGSRGDGFGGGGKGDGFGGDHGGGWGGGDGFRGAGGDGWGARDASDRGSRSFGGDGFGGGGFGRHGGWGGGGWGGGGGFGGGRGFGGGGGRGRR